MTRATGPESPMSINADNSMPQPMYQVGTLIDPKKIDHYYFRIIQADMTKRITETINKLHKEGYFEGWDGGELPYLNRRDIANAMVLAEKADSVELAGCAPVGGHVVGSVANQCYVRGVPRATSGLDWQYHLCFRRRNHKGQNLVFITPCPVIREPYIKDFLLEDSNPAKGWYTPGPWIVQGHTHIRSVGSACKEEEYIALDVGPRWPNQKESSFSRANALLMSMAPEMFEVLQKITEHAERDPREFNHRDPEVIRARYLLKRFTNAFTTLEDAREE